MREPRITRSRVSRSIPRRDLERVRARAVARTIRSVKRNRYTSGTISSVQAFEHDSMPVRSIARPRDHTQSCGSCLRARDADRNERGAWRDIPSGASAGSRSASGRRREHDRRDGPPRSCCSHEARAMSKQHRPARSTTTAAMALVEVRHKALAAGHVRCFCWFAFCVRPVVRARWSRRGC